MKVGEKMIIDFRCRPPYGETFKYLTCDLLNRAYEVINDAPTPPSIEKYDFDLFMTEMNMAGVDMGVVTGRSTCETMDPANENANNLAVMKMMEEYPGRFIGAWGVDPMDVEKSIKNITAYVINGPFATVLLEPGQSLSPMAVDDVRCLEIYDFCEAHHVPIMLAFGELNYRSMRHMRPEALDNICEMFEELKITVFHGGWPYVLDVQWIAYNRENFYISPDYTMMKNWPGHQDFICSANSWMQDKMIFGSAYPFCAMATAVEAYRQVLRPEVFPKVMGINALRALNLPVPDNAPAVAPHWSRRAVAAELNDLPLLEKYQKKDWPK